jgi:hypothetical protein
MARPKELQGYANMHVLQKDKKERAPHECLGMMNKPAYLVSKKP